MAIGQALDAHDTFRLALGYFHKKERERAEGCLSDIIAILEGPEIESKQVEAILGRLTDHYSRTGRGA